MDEKNNGGSAFPDFKQTGMSLRDYFAAQALAGIMSNAIGLGTLAKEAREDNVSYADAIANSVYELADAMIAERAK